MSQLMKFKRFIRKTMSPIRVVARVYLYRSRMGTGKTVGPALTETSWHFNAEMVKSV